MIKQVFEIEPIQKNSLLVYVAVCFMSFLQLSFLKKEIVESNNFFAIGLVLGMSLCWIVSSLPSFIIFISLMMKYDFPYYRKLLDKFILFFGFIILFWMLIQIFLIFQFKLDLAEFIYLNILILVVRNLIWITWILILNKLMEPLNDLDDIEDLNDDENKVNSSPSSSTS